MKSIFESELILEEEQRNKLIFLFGVRRFVWNRLLDLYYENDGKINCLQLTNRIYQELIENQENIWLLKSNLSIISETAKQLNSIILEYEDKKEIVSKISYIRPLYQKRKDINSNYFEFTENISNIFKPTGANEFELVVSNFKQDSINITTEKALLFLRLKTIELDKVKFYMTEDEKIFIKIVFENKSINIRNNDGTIGIDMGLKHPLSCYDDRGKLFYYNIPEQLFDKMRESNELRKTISNFKEDSKNKKKNEKLLEQMLEEEERIKEKFRIDTAEEICKNYRVIKIERYFVKSYWKDINSILGHNGSLFIEKLKEFGKKYDCNLIFVNGQPTTQTCSNCGHRKIGDERMGLDDKIFRCEMCDSEIPRDLNAAKNIYEYIPEKK